MVDFKAARLRKNLSQTELAEMIGRTPVQVSNYETGKSVPVPQVRRKIQQVLGQVDWPDQGRPLSDSEQSGMFAAIQVCSQRIGYQDTISLFADKGPDEIRKLTKAIIGEEDPLLPPDVPDKEGGE